MKRHFFVFAAFVLLAATSVAFFSCKKDKDESKNNQAENLLKNTGQSDMNKTMAAFGKTIKAASNERSGESMPVMEALNTLSNYQNYSMCNANYHSIEMLTDTIRALLRVTEGEVLLSELYRFYEATSAELLSRLNTTEPNQRTIFCIESVLDCDNTVSLNSLTGDVEVNVIAIINDPIATREYDPIFDDTLCWYDFEGLGTCNGEIEGQYLGLDCVSVISSRLHSNQSIGCGSGYQTYYTNINTLQLHANQFPDTSSPNGFYAIPWRMCGLSAQCVCPSDMAYYMDAFRDIFDGLEYYYMQPIFYFRIMGEHDCKDLNYNWEAYAIVKLGDMNCNPILPD